MATWNTSYSVDIKSRLPALWEVLTDAPNWSRWNAGVKAVDVEGAFVDGTWFTMTFPDGDTIRSQLIEVRQQEFFIDETELGENVVRVNHRVEQLSQDTCRVTFSVEASGPEAEPFGAGASEDFPSVLAGLREHMAKI